MAASSSSRKRARTSFASEESLISIRLADGGGAALAADKPLLQVVSECARGLPGDAAEWDLSGLLIEGQPVSRAVVVAWLHTVHTHVLGEPFPGEAQQEPPLNRSAAGLAQLLAFADAVGSSDRVLEACLPPLEQLQFVLRAGEQQQQEEVQLSVGGAYYWRGGAEKLELVKLGRDHKFASEEKVFTAPSDAAKAQLSQQFARQLEALLYLAHRLELDSLAQALHTCVRYNTAWMWSLLSDDNSIVSPFALSARVLQAAAGPGQHSQRAFINSLVSEPASFVAAPELGFCQVFKPLNLSAVLQRPLTFTAELAEDFMGAGTKGQVVDVEVDLFGTGLVVVGSSPLDVQLLLGQHVSGEAFGKLVAAHQERAAAAE